MTEHEKASIANFAARLAPRSGAYVDQNAIDTAGERAKGERLEQQARAILRVLQMSVRQAMTQSGLSTQEQINQAVADASIWWEDEFLPEVGLATHHYDITHRDD